MIQIDPVLIGTIIAAVGGLTGFAAFRKSGAERSNIIVNSATDVVQLMHDQLVQMQAEVEDIRNRVAALEAEVGAWKAWSNRVLDILDRAVSMLDPQQRKKIADEAERVKRQRPGHGAH